MASARMAVTILRTAALCLASGKGRLVSDPEAMKASVAIANHFEVSELPAFEVVVEVGSIISLPSFDLTKGSFFISRRPLLGIDHVVKVAVDLREFNCVQKT